MGAQKPRKVGTALSVVSPKFAWCWEGAAGSRRLGADARHRDPYALPRSWLDAKPKLNLQTPLNFVTTNDIIGGNSGSPVINKERQVVGLIFDGNIHSLGGNYGFDESVNRAVAVHSSAILEALEKIYGAERVLAEITRN